MASLSSLLHALGVLGIPTRPWMTTMLILGGSAVGSCFFSLKYYVKEQPGDLPIIQKSGEDAEATILPRALFV